MLCKHCLVPLEEDIGLFRGAAICAVLACPKCGRGEIATTKTGKVKTGGARPPRRESDEQIALFDTIRLYQDRYPVLQKVFHVPNGELRQKAVAVKLQRMGVRPGVLDVWCPARRGEWSGLIIEMKVIGNSPDANQEKWIAFLREQGFRVEVCYSADAAWRTLRDYLGLPATLRMEG